MLIRFRAKGRIFQASVKVPVVGEIIKNGSHVAAVGGVDEYIMWLESKFAAIAYKASGIL